MSKLLKIFLITTLIFNLAGFGALAQETEVTQAVEADENIEAVDLEVGEPLFLPGNPLYFFTRLRRGVQDLVTRDPVKKVELKLRFANERMIEAKRLAQRTDNPQVLENALEKYKEEIEKLEETTQNLKEKLENHPRVSEFLDKFTDSQFKQQKLIERLETEVPGEIAEKIKEKVNNIKEVIAQKLTSIPLQLETKEKFEERLDKIVEEQKGSDFKNFKNLEVLTELANKVPLEAREAIEKAAENSLKRLKGNLEEMSSEDQEKFRDYLEELKSEKIERLEVIDKLENIAIPQKVKAFLGESKKSINLKLGNKIREELKEKNQGEAEEPAKEQLKEERSCTTLWQPVCGSDGKTYSNECFAELAGVEVKSEGKCQITCPAYTPPAPNFCPDGEIIQNKDENGCLASPKCLKKTESETNPLRNLKSLKNLFQR